MTLPPEKRHPSLSVQHPSTSGTQLGFWCGTAECLLSQVGDFILHGGSDLLQPIAELHLLGRGVLLQRRDDLQREGTTSEDLCFSRTQILFALKLKPHTGIYVLCCKKSQRNVYTHYLVIIFIDVLVQLVQGHQVVELSGVVLKTQSGTVSTGSPVVKSWLLPLKSRACQYSPETARPEPSSFPGRWLRWSA